MSAAFAAVIAFAAIPAVAVVIGGTLAAFRTPSAAVRSAVQHIASGVLFAALATELLPDIMHRRLPVVTVVGFATGVAAMLGLKAITARWEASTDTSPATTSLPLSLIVTSGVDIALDGLLIGIGFAAGERQGVLLTIALTLEVLFLGVASAAALGGASAPKMRIVGVSLVFAVLLLLGAGTGTAFLASASPLLIDALMSFGLAALLYLVMEELMVEAHEVPETPLLTSFFVGFLALLVVEMLL